MPGFSKDDMVLDFQRGLELFNDKDLPEALQSPVLPM